MTGSLVWTMQWHGRCEGYDAELCRELQRLRRHLTYENLSQPGQSPALIKPLIKNKLRTDNLRTSGGIILSPSDTVIGLVECKHYTVNNYENGDRAIIADFCFTLSQTNLVSIFSELCCYSTICLQCPFWKLPAASELPQHPHLTANVMHVLF